MYIWHKIKELESEGISIKKIAKRLNLSKNTVRKYLRASAIPEFKKRAYSKGLNNYKESILEMLEKNYIGTRIYEELMKQGFNGSLSGVYRFIKEVQRDEKKSRLATTRVETPPGFQMQYDWKEWIVPLSGKELKIYIHEIILSYSRKKYFTISLDINSYDVIRAIEEGIKYFGGTAQELVIDNAKQMIITHTQEGVVRYNEEFLKFCGLYGIKPYACQNYRPRTKGKVERPFFYIQEHLLKGMEVLSIKDLVDKVHKFMQDYNEREHSTLKESPNTRFEKERNSLRSVNSVEPTTIYTQDSRQVSNDGYIPYKSNHYPVPMNLCCQNVFIEDVFGRILNVYDLSQKLVISHEINPFEKGAKPEHPEHTELNNSYQKKRIKVKTKLTEEFINDFGQVGEDYISGLKKAVGYNLYWHLSEILQYKKLYPKEQVALAIEECIKIGGYHKNTVKRLLEHYPISKPAFDLSVKRHITLPFEDITRDLSQYSEVSYE